MLDSSAAKEKRAATLGLENLRAEFRAKLAHLRLANTNFEHDVADRMTLVGIGNDFVTSFI